MGHPNSKSLSVFIRVCKQFWFHCGSQEKKNRSGFESIFEGYLYSYSPSPDFRSGERGARSSFLMLWDKVKNTAKPP
jgi:hypothetical protein